jgi:transcriptional regulator with XRE-family HTH domain
MNVRHYYPEKLVALREGAGLSQEALAEKLEVHKLTILRAEKGRSASYGLLSKYATEFHLAVTDLVRPFPVEASVEAAEAVV